MKHPSININMIQETLFFSHPHENLCQWIDVHLNNLDKQSYVGKISIICGDKVESEEVVIQPGRQACRAYAPTFWPDYPQGLPARLELTIDGKLWEEEIHIGSHRPWTAFLLSDACSDYLWSYDSVVASCADDAALTLAEIKAAEKVAIDPSIQSNHYNLVHAREVEYFLEYYPELADRLIDQIRKGTITLNPIYNMSLFSHMTLEEILRSFYPARVLSRMHNLLDCYANIQETPTAPWALPTILAGSGVHHLVRSLLPYETPWAHRLQEPPLYQWEGPDGSRINVRLRQQDYVEGNFILLGVKETNLALHESILPAYEQLGDGYPYQRIALVGCYGDLAENSPGLPALKVANIEAYNHQGWEYPHLVNASHKQFWEAITPEFEKKPLSIRRGDYGTSWEAWPASLAHDFAGWRRAQERAITSDRLAAILSVLDPAWYIGHKLELERAWKELISLADHAWNGAFESNREANTRLRHGWQIEANRAFDRLIDIALAQIGKRIPTGENSELLAFNSLGWDRSGLAWWPIKDPETVQIKDLHSNQLLQTQPGGLEGKPGIWMMIPDVPSVGYRVLLVLKGEVPRKPENYPFTYGERTLDSPYYSIEIDQQTGGICRIYDKIHQKELVDRSSPYTLNESVYWRSPELARLGGYQAYQAIETSQMQASHPKLVRVEKGVIGPLFGELIVHTELAEMQISTTLRLYALRDRIDIINEVRKPVTAYKEELDFAFPFNIPGRQYRYETPAAIIEPGIDQLPGSGQAINSVRRFVDVFNDNGGVTLAFGECGLMEFGHHTSGEDPKEPDPTNSTVLVVALQNCFDWNESIHDQGGETSFTFHFGLRAHPSGFIAEDAIQTSWEMDNELMLVGLQTDQVGNLPSDIHSFVSVEPRNIIVTGFKPAEAGGLLLRLWEVGGQESKVEVSLRGLGSLTNAQITDLLESPIDELLIDSGKVSLPIRGRGLSAVRLIFAGR